MLGAASLTLTFAAVAYAGPPNAIRDCAVDGDLDSRYSNRDLREAIDRLPSELAEYSNCLEIFEGGIAAPPASETKPAVSPRDSGAPNRSSSSRRAAKGGETRAVNPTARLIRPEAVNAGSAPVSGRQLEEPGSSSLLVWTLVACAASACLLIARRRLASKPKTPTQPRLRRDRLQPTAEHRPPQSPTRTPSPRTGSQPTGSCRRAPPVPSVTADCQDMKGRV